jgi:phosphatidylserine decarboxylase
MSIVKEGWIFIIVPVFLGILFLWFGRNAFLYIPGTLLILVGLFSAFFFRDPVRGIRAGENNILSPCDGTVLEVTEEQGKKVVRVFLSVLNVHLQRSPAAGKVTKVDYRPGKFLPAMNPQAHEVNEQNVITIETSHGIIIVKQIAGILARRVVSWVAAGAQVQQGDKIGLIKFGSQVDLSVPIDATINVKPGDKVVAGETIIGVFR